MAYWNERFEQLLDKFVFWLVLLVVAIIILGSLTGNLVWLYKALTSSHPQPTYGDRAVAVMMVVVFGMLSVYVRHRLPKMFGLLEVAAGVVTAWHLPTIAATAGPVPNLLAIGGAFFLVSRGLYAYHLDDMKRLDRQREERASWPAQHAAAEKAFEDIKARVEATLKARRQEYPSAAAEPKDLDKKE